jgi:hypothetical protein
MWGIPVGSADVEFVLRLLLATGCGLPIGLERQYRSRTAGLRTNALVAAGAAVFVAMRERGNLRPEADPDKPPSPDSRPPRVARPPPDPPRPHPARLAVEVVRLAGNRFLTSMFTSIHTGRR